MKEVIVIMSSTANKDSKLGSQTVPSQFIYIYDSENHPVIKSSYISASKVQKNDTAGRQEQSVVSQYMYTTESVNTVASRGSRGVGKARHDKDDL